MVRMNKAQIATLRRMYAKYSPIMPWTEGGLPFDAEPMTFREFRRRVYTRECTCCYERVPGVYVRMNRFHYRIRPNGHTNVNLGD